MSVNALDWCPLLFACCIDSVNKKERIKDRENKRPRARMQLVHLERQPESMPVPAVREKKRMEGGST